MYVRVIILNMKVGVVLGIVGGVLGYTHDKVMEYFHQFDTDHDLKLMRTEYELQLRGDDIELGMEQNIEYYTEITSLMFEKYDGDGDGGLDVPEWLNFATDIYDYTQEEGMWGEDKLLADE